MTRHVLMYGLIGGVLIALLKLLEYQHFIRAYPTEIYGGAIALLFTAIGINKGVLDFDRGEIIGYSSLVLSFLLVFFGIRSYRENVGGGVISFGRAFGVGILITLVSCLIYVLAWEIIYFNFTPDFLDKYSAHEIEKMREKGATEAAMAAKAKEMADFKVMYQNPLINAAITMIEPLPVGLILTLVSAGILRKKRPADATP